MLATVPGLPWWGAVLTLLAFTAAGAFAAGEITGANAGVLAIGVGALVAVLAVRNRALFTAMVQPPLVMVTAIPAYRWFTLPSPRKASAIVTDVIFPLISLFPWMFWITAMVIVVGGARFLLYRQLTSTARNAQRTSGAPKRAAATKKASAAKKAPSKAPKRSAPKTPAPAVTAAAAAAAVGTGVESASKASSKAVARTDADAKQAAAAPSIGARIGAALSRMRPAPSPRPARAAATGGKPDGGRATERHRSSARPERDARDRDVRDRDVRDREARDRETRRSEPRREAPRRDAVRREDPRPVPMTEAERLERRRAEVAARDAGAPATRVHRVMRPEAEAPRPPRPRHPAEGGRPERPHGAPPRPAVGEGDRPRPTRDPRDMRPESERRAPQPQPRWRSREEEREAASGPQRAASRPDVRDYRREARDIERARGTEPTAPRSERSRIPRDDFASLPRISGSRSAQPDLPSLTRDGERPARPRDDAASSTGRYEHYRAPRFRPTGEGAPAERDFRDDFTDPAEQPRQIRRYRYKD